MSFTIRPMQLDDLESVHRLENQIFKDPWSLGNFRSELNNQKFSYPCILLDQGVIVGYSVTWFYGNEIHISNFAIHPEYRRKGLGEYLLNHILEKFADYEAAFLEVRRSNLAAINLYTKFSFNVLFIRKGYYRDGEDALVMVKYLKT